jgi:hypothetical protein
MIRRYLTLATATGGMLAGGLVTTAAPAMTPITHQVAHIASRTATGWTADNWSGYGGSVTSANEITGTWNVPTVTKTKGNTYSSTWIGIDGFANSDLIQTGTEQDWVGGKAHYDAWWEILPAPETLIPTITVHPGDAMFADIWNSSGTTWQILLEDLTTNVTFQIAKTYTGPADSVEWIQEATEIGGTIATLAHYGSTTFTLAGFNGGNVTFVAADRGIMIQNGKHVSTPSLPGMVVNAFTVAYGAKTPKAPS